MSKRRMFDIDFPSGEDETPVPAGTDAPEAKPARRGPMASAISENAEALRQRQQAEAAIQQENTALAEEYVRLKKQGLIVDALPLDQIRSEKLTRDRSASRDPELDELKESIRAIGLSNPIRVEQVEGGYELVQGFRRLSAFRELFEETGDAAYAKIPAGLLPKGEGLDALYRRMVDENLVRRDISFAEMAALAVNYAADPGTDCDSVEEAVARLYASAGRQKRAYIRHFAVLLGAVGERLKFPEAIPRALGLDLEKKLVSDSGQSARLRSRLAAAMATTAEAELEVLRGFLKEAAPKPSRERAGAAEKVKTTFRLSVPAGTVRCSATKGRLELRSERDYSSIDRARLEKALAAFLAALDE
ncbi:ParB/RepB/Spo0J family partition protein [Pseudoruegeria sp. SHC-113]|uniref:ParB/RepB/Spo0J family partition protein n=1 Tax=Pseudoruegeria sp. SHC-113 TaxID=2855439 RepID=UPI0021BB9E95|nr:ParB N-terminal domain-containing protein [Pseudoruegeria sp. SHC-113]MCT8162133.1 ParB N-terminal domain-containing protein [Pseudoruegeria sp. SHC-113]